MPTVVPVLCGLERLLRIWNYFFWSAKAVETSRVGNSLTVGRQIPSPPLPSLLLPPFLFPPLLFPSFPFSVILPFPSPPIPYPLPLEGLLNTAKGSGERCKQGFARRSEDGQRTQWWRNFAESFNPPSRVHQRYRRQTTDRQTDDRQTELRQQRPERNVVTFG